MAFSTIRHAIFASIREVGHVLPRRAGSRVSAKPSIACIDLTIGTRALSFTVSFVVKVTLGALTSFIGTSIALLSTVHACAISELVHVPFARRS